MKKFNRGGAFGHRGFSKSGVRGGGKFRGRSFGRTGSGGDGEHGDRVHNRKLFSATCSMCGAPCQVPFRPDDSRPIYCRDCFHQHGASAGGGKRFKRDDRGPRHHFHQPGQDEGRGGPDQAELVRLLEKMNDKLDRLLEIMGDEGGDEE